MWRDEGWLVDIIQAAQNAIHFCTVSTVEELTANVKDTSAILYQIAIIGEAAGNVSEGFKSNHPEIPWAKIRGMRNRVVHDYRNIQSVILWDILINELPELIKLIEPHVPSD